MSKPILVGTYILGFDNVRVELDGNTDGCAAAVWYNPADGGCQKIVIRCRKGWADGVAVCESMEALLHRRAQRTPKRAPRNDGWVYVSPDHHTFDQCCDWGSVSVKVPARSECGVAQDQQEGEVMGRDTSMRALDDLEADIGQVASGDDRGW